MVIESYIIQILAFFIAVLTGGWMIFDGMYALKHEKYFGPEKTGPWSYIFVRFGVDPLTLAKVFIFLGSIWIVTMIVLLISGLEIIWFMMIVVAFCSLWYIPVGSLFSFFEIVLLLVFKTSFVLIPL